MSPAVTQAVDAVGTVGGSALFVFAVAVVGTRLAVRLVDHGGSEIGRALLRRSRRPLLLLAPVIAAQLSLAGTSLPHTAGAVLSQALVILLITGFAWEAVALTYVVDDVVLPRLTGVSVDNLRARRASTQIQVFRRIASVVIVVVAVAAALLTFSQVRALGASLLASAGIVAVVAGIAAKPLATNVVAGFQIAAAQPIRLDDVVVIEGHWGRIEEIALTYVVVRIWDLRRLVVPIVYFTENCFENWTRRTADLLSYVHLFVDFATPIDEMRGELRRVLAASELWDGKVVGLQVTEVAEQAMQVRALMSVRNSSDSWDLGCLVRERLVDWLHREHPECLPRMRGVLTGVDPAVGVGPWPTELTPRAGRGEASPPVAPGAPGGPVPPAEPLPRGWHWLAPGAEAAPATGAGASAAGPAPSTAGVPAPPVAGAAGGAMGVGAMPGEPAGGQPGGPQPAAPDAEA